MGGGVDVASVRWAFCVADTRQGDVIVGSAAGYRGGAVLRLVDGE